MVTKKKLRKLGRPLIAVGHSFGAVYAASIVTRANGLKIEGFASIAGPVSAKGYEMIGPHADRFLTDETRGAEKRFFSNPTEEGWKHCLKLWGSSYFSAERLEEGIQMLVSDQSSFSLMLAVAVPIMAGQIQLNLEQKLAHFRGPKLFVAGRNDRVVPLEAMNLDSESTGSQLVVLDAPHWIPLEKATALAELFFDTFAA